MKKSFFTFTAAAMIIAALMLTASNTRNTCTQRFLVCLCGTVWTYHTTTCTNEEDHIEAMAELFRHLVDYHGKSVPIVTHVRPVLAYCQCNNANPDFVCMSLFYRVLSEEELRAALAATGAGNWIFSENACGKESKIARVRRITRVHGIATNVLIVPSQSTIVSGETVECWRLYFSGRCR